MIEKIFKENSELLYKVGIEKYMNYKTEQLEINLSDFKIFNDNKKEIDTFYLHGVIFNKKTNTYIEENGTFRFKFKTDYIINSTNILKINNKKLIFKTINGFYQMYNKLDYEIHFLLTPLDYKFFNVITECEKKLDPFFLEESIDISRIQTSAKTMLKKTFKFFKALYIVIPFIVIIILPSSVSYYIISSGGFNWEIINPNFIINTIIYFFTYFFSQISSLILIFYIFYGVCMFLLLLAGALSKLSVITYYLYIIKKSIKWIFNIIFIHCHQNKKSYLVENININVYKIHKNNLFKNLFSVSLSISLFSILIIFLFVTFITIKDIIMINKQDVSYIQTNHNIIYTISKEYIYNTSFPQLIKTEKGNINILISSNEYEGQRYSIDEIKSVIKKSKNNCNFENIFDRYFFKNDSDSKNFKDFYLTFLFGNMGNVSSSKIRNDKYDYIERGSKEYLEIMELFEKELFN